MTRLLSSIFSASIAVSASIAHAEVHISSFTRHGLPARAMVIERNQDGPLWLYLYSPPASISKPPGGYPVVLILPMLGGRNLWAEEHLAKALARRGIASAIMPLPEQFGRRRILDLPSGFLFLERNADLLGNNFNQALKDVGFTVQWLQKENFGPIGISGISLGSLVASVAIGWEEKIKTGAFLLAGADPAEIILKGALTAPIARKASLSPEKAHKMLAPFNLASQKPLDEKKSVMIVEAVWDRIIPKSSRRKLRQSMPHAQVIRIPAGHLTSILHLFWVKERMARFFAENLK